MALLYEAHPNKQMFTLDRRVYTDAAGTLVEADNPARLTLVGAAGAAIPLADAQRLGLAGADGAPVGPPKPAPQPAPAPAPEDGGGTEAPPAADPPGSSNGPLSDGKALPGSAAENKAVKAPKATK